MSQEELAVFKSTNAVCYGAKCRNMKMYWYYCALSEILNFKTFPLGGKGGIPPDPLTGVCFTVYYHQDLSTLCADNQLLCILCINAYATVFCLTKAKVHHP